MRRETPGHGAIAHDALRQLGQILEPGVEGGEGDLRRGQGGVEVRAQAVGGGERLWGVLGGCDHPHAAMQRQQHEALCAGGEIAELGQKESRTVAWVALKDAVDGDERLACLGAHGVEGARNRGHAGARTACDERSAEVGGDAAELRSKPVHAGALTEEGQLIGDDGRRTGQGLHEPFIGRPDEKLREAERSTRSLPP